jgi:hypothetical protein
VLNNHPQGGFVTRRPTADVRVASDNVQGDNGFGSFFQRNWEPQPGVQRNRNSQTGNARQPAGQDYRWMEQGGR